MDIEKEETNVIENDSASNCDWQLLKDNIIELLTRRLLS